MIQDPGPVPLRVLIAMMTASTSYWGNLSREDKIPTHLLSVFKDPKAFRMINCAGAKTSDFPISGTFSCCVIYHPYDCCYTLFPLSDSDDSDCFILVFYHYDTTLTGALLVGGKVDTFINPDVAAQFLSGQPGSGMVRASEIIKALWSPQSQRVYAGRRWSFINRHQILPRPQLQVREITTSFVVVGTC